MQSVAFLPRSARLTHASISQAMEPTARRLDRPERSIPWAGIVVGVCAAPLVWAALRMVMA